jgi:hypothetical protein
MEELSIEDYENAAGANLDNNRDSVKRGDEARNGWKPGMRVGERVRMEADDLGPNGFCGLRSVTVGATNSTRSCGK